MILLLVIAVVGAAARTLRAAEASIATLPPLRYCRHRCSVCSGAPSNLDRAEHPREDQCIPDLLDCLPGLLAHKKR